MVRALISERPAFSTPPIKSGSNSCSSSCGVDSIPDHPWAHAPDLPNLFDGFPMSPREARPCLLPGEKTLCNVSEA